MARPNKSIDTSTGKIGKAKKEARREAEQRLRGNSDNIVPPSYLSSAQKVIFENIVDELRSSGILTNIDTYVLATCSIAIDRLQVIETMINQDINQLTNKEMLSAKDKYTKDVFKCFTELSLTPASRAKIGAINIQNKQDESDPLLRVLKGGSK